MQKLIILNISFSQGSPNKMSTSYNLILILKALWGSLDTSCQMQKKIPLFNDCSLFYAKIIFKQGIVLG